MTTAFQATAFQNNAFQIDDGVVVIIPPAVEPRGAGGWRKIRRRETGIYWPRKTKKRDEKEIVAEVVAEALEQMPVAELPREIHVGVLAVALIETHSYQALRRVNDFETLIQMIQRELDEQDDEEALLLLF